MLENQAAEAITANNRLDDQRTVLRAILPEVVEKIGIALRDAQLQNVVCIGVPNSGTAIAMVMSGPDPDPDDADWQRIDEIVREIIGKKLGILPLFSTELACGAASQTIKAHDLTSGSAAI